MYTLLDLLSDAEERKDLARSTDFVETVSENDPAFPRCQAGLRYRYDIRKEFEARVVYRKSRSSYPAFSHLPTARSISFAWILEEKWN